MSQFIDLINLILTLFSVAILARVILSWVVPMTGGRPNPVVANIISVVTQVTEPILGPLRRVIPTVGSLDLSPMAAILIIAFIQWALGSLR